MAFKFRLNQYNWFSQKLLAQHQYGEILKLRQYLDNQHGQISRVSSEQMDYINSIALAKTGDHLGNVIRTLEKLNFYKNNQYFLLLCRYLLYLGNYDSVVELCKQMINKEVDLTSDSSIVIVNNELDVDQEEGAKENLGASKKRDEKERKVTWSLDSLANESLEFRKLLANVSRNPLLNDPRLWFIFGTSLEFQRQLRDAELAFKLAIRLSWDFGRSPRVVAAAPNPSGGGSGSSWIEQRAQATSTCISNYYAPHIKYALFTIRHKGSAKAALHILNEASSLFAQNHTLNPLLALVTSAQPLSNPSNFARAFEVISSLETQFMSNRNPAITYNNLSMKLKLQQQRQQNNRGWQTVEPFEVMGDEHRFNLDYLLTRSHIALNSIVQDSSHSNEVYTVNLDSSPKRKGTQLKPSAMLNKVDRLIELLRNSDSSCWSSAALWNNLGLCYLLKRRFIACLSCFLRAQHLNSLDWRINYNTALAYLHVGLVSRAVMSTLAAKNSYLPRMIPIRDINQKLEQKRVDALVISLLAYCFDRLDLVDEARRYYVETTRTGEKGSTSAPVVSLVNYLVYLHRRFDETDDETNKLKSRLLDQLEHSWLQRNQNDPQFNNNLMELARRIGEETARVQGQIIRKTYAWTKTIENTKI